MKYFAERVLPLRHLRLLIAMTLGLGLILGLLWVLRGPSNAAMAQGHLAPVSPDLARWPAPVVVAGSLLPDLAGSPLDEVFVYAYQGSTPIQIPFQIDERDAGGMYVAVEDGHLDGNDELVFMAADSGGWVDHPSLGTTGAPITPTYVVTITDPISDTHAWAYVFRSAVLSRVFTADYVSYDAGNDRITSPGRYGVGFDGPHGFMDYLTLGDSGQDVLDRAKLRISGTLEVHGTLTPLLLNEENISKDAVHVIDGPVRVTRVSTSTRPGEGGWVRDTATLFAYRSLVVRPETVVIPGAPAHIVYLRTSLDWNEHVAGMTYYDANNPAGAIIDGGPDTLVITPSSTWSQVTGVSGTLVIVSETPAGLGGSPSTYYKDDDSVVDGSDTGDRLSYGDAGLQVDNPNPDSYVLLGHIYFPTSTLANVGATYAGYYDNPLQTSVGTVRSRWTIYLPLVAKDSP